MFLTAAEIKDLTGYQAPAAQKRWLARNGWAFAVSAFGHPKVLRAYAEQRMGLAGAAPAAQNQPDFSRWEPV